MSQILDFYNFLPSSQGITLDQIWKMSYDKLDKCHDYIQWLFPTQEVSKFHPDAPLLTDEDIKKFKEDVVLKYTLIRSFNVMLDFFGLEKTYTNEGIAVEKTDNYETRKLVWQTPINHNHLRITRILTCLRLCGLEKEAEAFYSCLMKIIDENPNRFTALTVAYWSFAVYPELEFCSLSADENPEGIEAICENCGKPCDYDSVMCLCGKCFGQFLTDEKVFE
jgi:hypothetical protein